MSPSLPHPLAMRLCMKFYVIALDPNVHALANRRPPLTSCDLLSAAQAPGLSGGAFGLL